MLHFILAGQGAGKSTLISSLIKEYALGGKERISLIVPEQYSFTAERICSHISANTLQTEWMC